MYSGVSELYSYQNLYCRLTIQMKECRWWELVKKKTLKEQLDWFYPLMRGEVELLSGKTKP